MVKNLSSSKYIDVVFQEDFLSKLKAVNFMNIYESETE